MRTDSPVGVFLANHSDDTCYRWWDIERWKREIAHARTLGANTVWYLPMQYGEHPPADLTDDSPYWQLQQQISAAIAETHMKVGIYCGINDTFVEVADTHPDWKAALGRYMDWPGQICPSVPEARAEILRVRERVYATLPHLDYIISPPTDLGGCSCEKCAPWPRTYLALFEEQAAIARRYHPHVKIVAAAHGMSSEETEMLRADIRGCDWIDYVADNPRGAGKPYLKYYMAPEITMLSGWGKYGASPRLSIIARDYHLDAKSMGGAVVYSEGIHDDINRCACMMLCKDSSLTAYDLALSYSRGWLRLPESDAELMAGIILALEKPAGVWLAFEAYNDYDLHGPNPQADTNLLQMIRLLERQPHLYENYRYWLLHYRAACICLSLTSGSVETDMLVEEAILARDRLVDLEPAYGNFLKNLSMPQRPGDIPWMWPRTFHQAWQRERQLGENDLLREP